MPAERGGAPGGRVVVMEPSPVLMAAIDPGDAPGGRPAVHLHAGGQGFWLARMAAELGGRPRLCAPLGGRPGLLLPPLMEMEGVEVDAVVCHRSSGVWISTGKDGEPATIVETPPPPLDRHEADQLYGRMLTAAMQAGVAVLTGLSDPRILPAAFYRRLAADLSRNGVTVVADVSSHALAPVLAGGVDLLKVSDEDLVAYGWARDRSRAESLRAIADLRTAGARAVVVSRAAEPAIAHTGLGLVELRPPRLEELNRRGAGDAMTGALAAGFARGLPLRDVLRLAVAAGTLNVSRLGLGTGDRRAIEQLAESVVIADLDLDPDPPTPEGSRRADPNR